MREFPSYVKLGMASERVLQAASGLPRGLGSVVAVEGDHQHRGRCQKRTLVMKSGVVVVDETHACGEKESRGHVDSRMYTRLGA
jgi:hypothetical protein